MGKENTWGGVKGILEWVGELIFFIKEIGGHPFHVLLDIVIICVCVEGVTSKKKKIISRIQVGKRDINPVEKKKSLLT